MVVVSVDPGDTITNRRVTAAYDIWAGRRPHEGHRSDISHRHSAHTAYTVYIIAKGDTLTTSTGRGTEAMSRG